MKRASVLTAAAVICATGAFADATKPGDVVFVDGAVEASLTGQAGDPVEGRKVFSNRKLGNCLACHNNADMPEELFHGEVAPPVDGVGSRWNEAELRGLLTNAKNTFDGTIMPAFYIEAGYERPLGKFEGKSILTAQQVEDVLAYLMTLKDE